MDRSKTLSKSWDGNAGNWTKAVREGQIPSRRAGTDDAIVTAILNNEPSRLLDVGCGEGWLIRRILQSAECEAVGIDGSEALIADAAQADSKSDYRAFGYDGLIDDATALGGGFDAIVFNHAILDEKASPLVAAIRPLLSARGRVFIQTLHPWTQDGGYRDGWRTEDFSAFDAPGWKPMPWYFRTLDSWLSEVGDAGLVLQDLIEPMAEGGDRPLSLILICRDGRGVL